MNTPSLLFKKKMKNQMVPQHHFHKCHHLQIVFVSSISLYTKQWQFVDIVF